jgi:hypothetical protein
VQSATKSEVAEARSPRFNQQRAQAIALRGSSRCVIIPPPKRRNSAANPPSESRAMCAMQTHTSRLAEKLLIIYEMDGREAVVQYARKNGIPLAICNKIISDYEVARGLRALAAGR